MAAKRLDIQQLGVIEFEKALALQRELRAARAEEMIPNRLLLMEHPHTFILGRSSRREQLLMSEEKCRRYGIALHRVDRSQRLAYHGPGQLIVWAILDLAELGGDFHRYLHTLEEVVLQALARCGIAAVRLPAGAGIGVLVEWETDIGWAAKIAGVDAAVDNRGITGYGFSVNVAPDLRCFDWIIPHDIYDCNATSIAAEAPLPLGYENVVQIVTQTFAEVFGFTLASQVSGVSTKRAAQPAALSAH